MTEKKPSLEDYLEKDELEFALFCSELVRSVVRGPRRHFWTEEERIEYEASLEEENHAKENDRSNG